MQNHKTYSNERIDKIGNAIRYLTAVEGFSKTKILKLIYLLEELSIKKHGVPFFNISFQVWKFGPVAEPVFVETSGKPSMFKKYFEIEHSNSGNLVKGIGEFDDFYFSDYDMDILEEVYSKYHKATSTDLVKITHRVNSPWYNEAVKRGILEDLNNEEITNTHYTIDIESLIEFSEDKLKLQLYRDFIESEGNPNVSESIDFSC